MDFFEHQEAARKRTGLLVFYFILAVLLIIAVIYFAFSFLFIYYGTPESQRTTLSLEALWSPELALTVSGSILLIVLLGSLYKTAQLSSGGKAVAEMLGGHLIKSSTKDLNERKILNVVEEMAIASGTPVPPVYLLDEEGINAFAAGFRPDDAVIGVTRGCIQQLSRNELQGVIAHEFSHILNGDMRLNIRLTGVLHGILVLAMIGYLLFRMSATSRSSSEKKGSIAIAFALLGLFVMVVGYIGVFFGKLIKSAVSRQREFLADASAVQFTRDPSGISGALKKIAGFVNGSRLMAVGAEQASHFFFADGLARTWFNLMATHPPIEERIRRIEGIESGHANAEVERRGPVDLTVGSLGFVSGIGTISQSKILNADKIVSSLPKEILEGLRTTAGAKAIIIGLLISKTPEIRRKQLLSMEKWTEIKSAYLSLSIPLEAVGPRNRLPLVELAVRTLKEMNEQEFAIFMEAIDTLVDADNQMDIFEYSLRRMVERRLSPTFRTSHPSSRIASSPRLIREHLSVVLTVLAVAGAMDQSERLSAYRKGMSRFLKSEWNGELPEWDSWSYRLDASLDLLSTTAFPIRKEILESCVECAFFDRRVTVEESELLRIFADALGCPIPPILD